MGGNIFGFGRENSFGFSGFGGCGDGGCGDSGCGRRRGREDRFRFRRGGDRDCE